MRDIIDVWPSSGNQNLSERNTPPSFDFVIMTSPLVLKANANKKVDDFSTGKVERGDNLSGFSQLVVCFAGFPRFFRYYPYLSEFGRDGVRLYFVYSLFLLEQKRGRVGWG